MPVWYNFIVNDELEAWAVIATYEEDFSVFYLWTPDDTICELTPDWKSENPEDNIWGFFIAEDSDIGACSLIEEYGWEYASYTYDEETMLPISVTGPFGNEWSFLDEVSFAAAYPTWSMEF